MVAAPRPFIAIVGPTAAGKTELALRAAEAGGGEILICDAYQLRAGLPILTAKPTAEDLARAPHHLVGALPLDEPDEALHQGAGAAHREVHAPLALEERDERVDRGDGERIAAHEQGMEAQGESQALVLHVLRHQAVHRAVAAQADHLRRHLRHVQPGVEGHVAELLEPDAVRILADAHEALVTLDVARREAGHALAHPRGVGAAVEGRAVGVADRVERRHRLERDVVLEAAAGEPPEILEEEGRRDDRGAGVEGESVLPVHVRAAAGRVEPLEDGHPVAAGAQPHRGGEAPEAAPDHDRVGPARGVAGERGADAIGCQRIHLLKV